MALVEQLSLRPHGRETHDTAPMLTHDEHSSPHMGKLCKSVARLSVEERRAVCDIDKELRFGVWPGVVGVACSKMQSGTESEDH